VRYGEVDEKRQIKPKWKRKLETGKAGPPARYSPLFQLGTSKDPRLKLMTLVAVVMNKPDRIPYRDGHLFGRAWKRRHGILI
jgi:hypothetical protein